VLFALHVFSAVSPVISFGQLAFKVFHGQCLATLLRITRTDVGTVTATQTIENVYLNTECHTIECFTYSFQLLELSTLLLFSIEYERTDRSVRTNVSTLVTLNTVFSIPFGNECSYTTFFVFGSTLIPSTVFDTLECRYRQQVTVLCIDRTNYFVDESRIIVFCFCIIRQVSPSRIDSQSLVFTTAVYSSVVLVNNVFTLLAVRLNDEFLHLFNSLIYRDYACDTEECRLKDCIGTVAQTNFHCNLSCVDIVYRDVVLCKVFLHLVRQVLSQFFAFPDGIQQERTVLTQTTCYVVHVQVSLNVTSNEVRSIYQVSRTDRSITETQVRTSETTRLLGVVREVSLTVFVGVVTDNLNRVLVGTYSTVSTQTVEFSFEHTFTAQSDFFFLRKRSERNVVYDTDSEVVLRHWHSQVFEYRDDLCRSCIF